MKHEAKQTITHTFDPETLQSLIDNALTFYHSRTDTYKDGVLVPGAVVEVNADFPSEWLDKIEQYLVQGYKRHPSWPINIDRTRGMYILSAAYIKPQHLQAEDVALISAEVEAEYRAELKQRYDAHLESIIAESVTRAETAERKKAEAAREKIISQARKDAIQALGEFPE